MRERKRSLINMVTANDEYCKTFELYSNQAENHQCNLCKIVTAVDNEADFLVNILNLASVEHS